MAPVATATLSRQARNLSSGVRMRSRSARRAPRPIASAVHSAIDSACSVGTSSFISCRRISGKSITVRPNAMRPRAAASASFTQRRIIAAARTPCDRRDRFTCSIICLRPRVDVADQVGLGALEADLAAGHGLGAELVLQAHDPVGVARAVVEPARQGEQREAARAARARLRPGQHQRDIGIGVGAEPFLAVQPPDAVLVAARPVSIAPTSEPPAFSVMNCVPFHMRGQVRATACVGSR